MGQSRKKSSLKKLLSSEAVPGYIFAAPFLIGLMAFVIVPFFMSLYYSFTNYNMRSAPKFIGLTNYKILFTSDKNFWPSLLNTLYHVGVAVPIMIVFGIFLALLLNHNLKGIGIFRTIYYLPNVVSIVAMALLWMWLFQPSYGIINQVLSPIFKLLDIPPIGWLADSNTSKLAIAIMGLWNVGGAMVIYLAQLQEIPPDVYEAAEVDGVGRLRRLFNITLPLLTPSIFYNLIMSLISAFQIFMQSFIMTPGGNPRRATYYLAYYIYDTAFEQNKMGMASAMAWILLVVTLIFTAVIFLTSKKWVFYMDGKN